MLRGTVSVITEVNLIGQLCLKAVVNESWKVPIVLLIRLRLVDAVDWSGD